MSQIPSLLNANASNPSSGNFNAFNDLDVDVFLKLLITELQNQDPLNPLDNSQMLEQIHQLREIGATDKLTNTLDSVLLGQNITSSTNLIGQDVNAISDDNQRVSGTVSRVSIENGKPKLHLDLAVSAEGSIERGNLEKGEYSYRIVWQGENGPEGIDLSGEEAVSTLSATSDFTSVRLRNLPITEGAKQIYRTDKSGAGDYRLVAILTDGTQANYLDTTADGDRSETRQTGAFTKSFANRVRSFKVSLENVADIFANDA
jgi:flagellar basal-body rod modification protein FlgD